MPKQRDDNKKIMIYASKHKSITRLLKNYKALLLHLKKRQKHLINILLFIWVCSSDFIWNSYILLMNKNNIKQF